MDEITGTKKRIYNTLEIDSDATRNAEKGTSSNKVISSDL